VRLRIGFKIFSVALGLLVLMGAAALLSLRMTKTVDDQLEILAQNYYPAYVALAHANIHSVEESAFVRRLYIALDETPRAPDKVAALRASIAGSGKASDADLAEARADINRQIAHPLDFNDDIELARLDTRIEFLQADRQRYEQTYAKLAVAMDRGDEALDRDLLDDLDQERDQFDKRLDGDRVEMNRLAGGAIEGTRAYQSRVVGISLALLLIAALLGISVAAAVTTGLVRPVRRLLAGTAAVEGGALDTIVQVPLFIGDRVDPFLEAYRHRIALYVGGMGARGANFYNDLAVRYGYVDEAAAVQELYLSGDKVAAAAALPDDLLTATSLIGSESHVRERLGALKASGATTIVVMPLAPTAAGRLEAVEAARAMLDELG